MIVEHLEVLDFGERRCGLIALFVEIPSILILIALGVFDPFHHPRSGLAIHGGQVGIIAILASFLVSLIGLFLDKKKGVSAAAFCVPIIFLLFASVGY